MTHQNRLAGSGAWIFAILLLSTSPLAQQAESGDRRPARSAIKSNRQVVRAADTDCDGEITANEWSHFCEAVGLGPDGGVDESELRARILVSMLDQNEDALLTPDDLYLLFERIDRDADFAISESEFPAGGWSRPGLVAGTGPTPKMTMSPLPFRAADANGDGEVTTDEWGFLVDTIDVDSDGRLSTAMLVRWMDAEQLIDTGDAFEPGAILRWVSHQLDANEDGVLQLNDLQTFFDALDTNGDGALRRSEMAFSRSSFRLPADRSLPPLMPWQRNLEDALTLCEATGKPLLICVNMDDEFSSESLAWSRYRDPAFVELASGFIPLLVSPNRHERRDRDDQGRRIVDPKFGRVTNSEHIDLEPILFERYFDGRRVSPRHLAVDVEGNILFDIFLVNDLELVDNALREHGKPGARPIEPGLMSEAELLASADALHRDDLEAKFLAGDERTRARLTSLALSSKRAVQQPELLRLALVDRAESIRLEAVWSILRHPLETADASLDFFVSAYRVCYLAAHSATTTDVPTSALLSALERVGTDADVADTRARARRLHSGLAGLGSTSAIVDVDRYRVALSWASPLAAETVESKDELYRRRDEIEQRLALDFDDPEVNLAFASAAMQHAKLEIREGRDPSFLLEDVVAAADRVLRKDDANPRALAHRAWARHRLSAFASASDDVARALPRLLPWAGTPLTGIALELLADTRTRAIYAAIDQGGAWPMAWTADVVASYEVLLEHPSGSETHALDYVEFLNALQVRGPQIDVLRRGLARFPLSGELHAELRRRLLLEAGAAELERIYAEIDFDTFDATLTRTISWYDGQALIAAAERHVENGAPVDALAAYQKSADRFRLSEGYGGDSLDSAGHYLCLALAGVARIHIDNEHLSLALEALREGVPASPESVWVKDRLGVSPRDTAQRLYRSLIDHEERAAADSLFAFLDENGLTLEG